MGFSQCFDNGYHLVVQLILQEIGASLKFDGVLREGAVVRVLITFSDSSSFVCSISRIRKPYQVLPN